MWNELTLKDLKNWLAELILNFQLLRNKFLEMTRVHSFYDQIVKDNPNGFSLVQRQFAEAWILRGTWAFGGKNLEYSDFYPTKSQLDGLFTELITKDEHDLLLSEIKNNLFISQNKLIDNLNKKHFETIEKLKLEYESEIYKDELIQWDKATIKRLLCEKLESKNKIEELNFYISKLNRKIGALQQAETIRKHSADEDTLLNSQDELLELIELQSGCDA